MITKLKVKQYFIKIWKDFQEELRKFGEQIFLDIAEWVVDLYIQIEEIKEEGRKRND